MQLEEINNKIKEMFVADSGCTSHMVNRIQNIINILEVNQ